MEKLLDKIVTVIFIIALIAILYFVGQYVMNKMGAKSTADNIDQVDDNDPFSDAGNVDDLEDNSDPEGDDYYGDDDSEEKVVPEGYDDEIAKIMKDVVSDPEEKAASASDAVVDGVKDAGETATEAIKSLATKVTKDESSSSDTSDDNQVVEKATTNNSSTSIDDDNRYMVVAGTFTSNANADKHATKLEKEGFTPEIVNFNNSRMYTVIASRYDSEANALAAAKKLRTNKIDCYVHRKRKK
jgi:cell division protein FtsN